MKKCIKLSTGIVLCIFLIPILSTGIVIPENESSDNQPILVPTLRGEEVFEFNTSKNGEMTNKLSEITSLSNSSNLNRTNPINFRVQGTGTFIEDYVDNQISDVDSVVDVGDLTDFDNMKDTDNVYANLSESMGGGGGIILFVDSVQATSTTQTVVLPAPTVSDGDFMVAIIGMPDDDPLAPITMTTVPSGWNEAVGKTNMDTLAVSPPAVWVYTKVASSESGTYTWAGTNSPLGTGSVGVLYVFSGVNSTLGTYGIINTLKSSQTGTGNDPIAPSITTMVGDTVMAFAWTDNGLQTVTTFPSSDGLTGEESPSIDPPTGNNGMTLSVGYEGNVTGTTSGTYSWTMSAIEERSAFTFNIRPTSVIGSDYNLDHEVQFEAVFDSTLVNEELRIKTGSFGGTENLSVSYWDGASWQFITNLTASSWNNFTITDISATEPYFTVKFAGGNTSGDDTQDWWTIDAVLVYVEEHIIETVEDYIDRQSDMDSNPDLGIHNIFDDLLGTDSIYDRIEEEEIFYSPNTTLINAESFEGTWPPTGWSESGVTNWAKESNSAYDGTYSADFDGADPGVSGRLNSPTLDTSDATAIHIEFWWRDAALDNNEFYLELYNGISWITYQDMNYLPHTENTWTFYSVKITDSQYFKSNFQLRWRANDVENFESAFIDLVTVKKETTGTSEGFQLDLEVQFTGVYNSLLIIEELCIKTGTFGGTENLNVTYWDGSSWQLITSSLTASTWNNFSISALTSPEFTIRFGGSTTSSSDNTQDWWDIDSVLLTVESPDEILGVDSGFIWLDTPDEVDLGTTYSSWVQQDLSDDSVPANATGVILAWVEDSITEGRHAVARGSEDPRDYMDGGVVYNEIEAETWRMQIVKLDSHKYIDTWRVTSSERLYVMGYTVGSDPLYHRVPIDLGSLTADSTWRTLTVNNVQPDTTGLILFAQSTDSTDSTILVRAVGSTDSMTAREWEEYNSGLFFVKLDAADQFQYYISIGDTAKLYIVAEVSSTIDWLDTNRDSISAVISGWTTIDLDSYISVHENATGVILQHETSGFGPDSRSNIARKKGQSWTFPRYDVGYDQWLMGGSGIAQGHKIEIYAETVDADLYIHALTLYYDNTPPMIHDFGVDDKGDGSPTFWANTTDFTSTISSVTLLLNSTQYSMSKNGSGFWVTQPSGISFNDYFTYRVNASDEFGNIKTSNEKIITFNLDNIQPTVLDWEYFNSEGVNGTFRANASDSWGIIDTVIVNITYHEVLGSLNTVWAVMVNTTSGYMNNTIDLQRGSMNFTIRVNDTGGNVYISPEHTGYFLNTPPLVENLTLSSDPSSEVLPVTSNSTLYVLYDYFDLENDLEASTEIKWYRWNTTHWEYKVTRHNLTSGWLVRGDIWRATVKPQDSDGDFGELVTSPNITIRNSAPAASNVIINPDNPKTDSLLNAYYEWYDVDSGDSQDLPGSLPNGTIIEWYRNRGAGFVFLSAYTNLTQLSASETLKGDIIYFNVTPSDGLSYGRSFKSNEVTIQNTLPIITIFIWKDTEWITSPVTIDSATDLEANNTNFDLDSADVLTGLEVSWFKYNFVLSKFEWQVNETISGAIGPFILKSGNTTDGDIWIVKMRIYDGTTYSDWFSSSSIRIGAAQIPNQLPSAFSVNLTSSNNVAGGFLFANYTFSDPDGDDEGPFTQFAWYKWDNTLLKWIYQSQFSELTRNLTTAQLIKGEKWKVSVRPQDNNTDYGSWSLNSSEIIIANTAPFVASAEIDPDSNVHTTDTLLASWLGDDVDNDLLTIFSIVWINGSIEVIGLYNETEVPSSYTRKGETWFFKIKLWDGIAWSANFTTTSITILNSIPRLENVTLSGGTNTLTDVTITYDWVDLDGDTLDALQSKINWTVERGVQVVALVNGTWILDSTYFVAGDFITIQITPHDGSELGEIWAAYRVRITVGNAKPSIDPTPNILDPDDGTVFYASNQLFANYSASDPDSGESNPIYDLEIDGNGLVVGAEYQWFRNGLLISELTSYYVPISYLARGDTWKFSVRPKDRWGAFGNWVNSSQIIIINTPPIVTEFYGINLETRSDMDLDLVFVFYDYDGDLINITKTLVKWYNFTTLIPGTINSTFISVTQFGDETHVRIRLNKTFYQKDHNITVEIQPFDNYEWALQLNQSFFTIIKNALPTVSEVTIKPNGTALIEVYTTDPLNISWSYDDWDNDDEVQSQMIIVWYNKGLEQVAFENRTSISPQNTTKGDLWHVEIQVFDGFNYSVVYISNSITILNSPPIITGVQISSNENNLTQTYADTFLVINPSQDINNIDPDSDPILWQQTLIYWFKNGVHQPQFDNELFIPSSALVKGDFWYANVSITDDINVWSLNYTSTTIYIVNKAPEIDIVLLSDTRFNNQDFIVEDEDINIFILLEEVDQADVDSSFIVWQVNGEIQDQYNNLKTINWNQTQPGQTWTFTVYPSDGFSNGSSRVYSFYIESKARIFNFSYTFDSSSEGLYEFAVLTEDILNNSISAVRYEIFLANSTIPVINTILSSPNGTGHWVLSYILNDLAYLNTNATIKITATTQVNYSIIYYITSEMEYIFRLEDKAPPRILPSPFFVFDDPDNPTKITFYADVEDFGSSIAEVFVYYYFVSFDATSETAGIGAYLMQTESQAIMELVNQTGNIYTYSVTVDFDHGQSDIEIHYRISTRDQFGNSNDFAYDNTDTVEQDIFYYTPVGLPQEVLIIAGAIIFLIFIGAVVYVRFIRKPEIRGLDKELVLENVKEITDTEIMNSLDTHTIGIVVSFFDQRHGPVPIITIPDILKDNWAKLVDLSDRSFSGTQFTDEFDMETVSNYDFLLDRGVRVSVMSFGFSLERLEARGGQENVTENILIHKEVFPLLNQFQEEIQTYIHKTHLLMDKESSEKGKIRNSVFRLRKYITAIVLSYQSIYGTIELLEEED